MYLNKEKKTITEQQLVRISSIKLDQYNELSGEKLSRKSLRIFHLLTQALQEKNSNY